MKLISAQHQQALQPLIIQTEGLLRRSARTSRVRLHRRGRGFIRGMGSVLQMMPVARRRRSGKCLRAKLAAPSNDWQNLGQDLVRAMLSVAGEQK